MNLLKNWEKYYNKGDAENENQQDIVPADTETDDENEDKRVLPKFAASTAFLRDILGSFKKNCNSFWIEQDDSESNNPWSPYINNRWW